VKRLTTRLVALLMLAFLCITGAYDYLSLERERDRMVELTTTDQRIFAETLAVAVRHNVRRGRTTEELVELLEEIRRRPGLTSATIYGPKGAAIAASVAAGGAPATSDQAVLAVLGTRTARSDMIDTPEGKVLRYIQPLRWPGGGTAAVEVRQSLDSLDREFAQAVRESIVSRVIVLVLFVFSILAVARWSLARPIRALIRGARAVGGGDLTQRIDVARADELGQLALEFNRMAESLQQAHLALVEQSEQRLALERKVQETQKLVAVGMLAAEVAHELGTPLNVISGRTEALLRSQPPDHPDRRPLDVIRGQTERITNIVHLLLDYARPRQTALREEDLGPLLARVVSLLEGRCREQGVRIRLELPPTLPPVLADADQLQQVFVNLLANALDASPRWSTIRVTEGPEPLLPPAGRAEAVRGKAEAPVLTVHVLDEGPGMSAEALARIFQPFFSTKRRGHGTGLGLAIVEEIVRAHRGEVAMLSIEGHGTEAIVRLPVAAPRRVEPPGAAARLAVGHGD
jgi:signal transduction histidine kinase